MTQPVEPVDLIQDAESLTLVWKDGHRSVYPLQMLRKACPCATCRTHRREAQRSDPLRVLPPDAALNPELKEIEYVGWYAFRFRWADGHDTGIYSFELLRELCPCEECADKRKG